MRFAHGCSFCGRSQEGISPLRRRGGGFPIAPATPSGPCLLTGIGATRWLVAAALSAAVTSANSQEISPNSHGREPPKEQSSLFPAALREGARGRGFSQRSRLPRIPHGTYLSSGGGPGEGLLFREAASPGVSLFSLYHAFSVRWKDFGRGKKKNLSTIIERIVDKCLQLFFPAPAASAC